MDVLFEREQTAGSFYRVNFKLFAQVELDEEEQALVEHYRMDEAVLIAVLQPELIRFATGLGFLVFLFSLGFFYAMVSLGMAFFLAFLTGCAAAYWYVNEKRETIFMRDLMHGRHFKCASVIELAQKEAWLHNVVATLRQVMESSKNWGGPERHAIEPLPPEEAKQVILRL